MDRKMIGPLRKVMAEFIRADKRDIALRRPLFEKTDTGGYLKTNWSILPEQEFRLVPYKRRLSDLIKVVDAGDIPHINYVLVGFYNCDIQVADEFELDGAYYQVEGIEPHTANPDYTDRVVAQLMVLDSERVAWSG